MQIAIASQTGVEVNHEVIKDLQEHEAHNRLWLRWNELRESHDLFVKIDADTILADPDKLASIYSLFAADNDVTGAQIPLWDYFTDREILGLNVFSPAVYFVTTEDTLYCDRNVERGHKKVLRGEDVAHLAPAGFHCKHPHPHQAFHFGYHRMLKGQFEIIQATAQAWQNKGGEGRQWALVGAWMALRLKIKNPSYRNKRFSEIAARCIAMHDWPKRLRGFVPSLMLLPRRTLADRVLLGLERHYWRLDGLWR